MKLEANGDFIVGEEKILNAILIYDFVSCCITPFRVGEVKRLVYTTSQGFISFCPFS